MQKELRIGFAGTPEIAAVVLEHILQSGFKVEIVLTQPDRPANRGKKITASPVKNLALKYNIEVLQPESVKNNTPIFNRLSELNLDILIVVAYGLILPLQLLEIPALGCINIHVSLLPKYRGAAPIQRAILAGEHETGVTIMQMDTGMDTGAILMQQAINIDKSDTAGSLHDKLARLGALMIVDYLAQVDKIQPVAQIEKLASYAPKITKQEAQIDWQENAIILARKVRGFNPSPGAFTTLDGELVKLWHAEESENIGCQGNKPGTIIDANSLGLKVACGEDTILIVKELQLAGRTRQMASQFVLGYPSLVGKIFT